jgi:hypothetical protein
MLTYTAVRTGDEINSGSHIGWCDEAPEPEVHWYL